METANVIENMLTTLRADSALTGLLSGTNIYKNKSRKDIQIPGIYWTIVSAVPSQNEFAVVVQWDVFATSFDAMSQIEARLYALMHSDVVRSFNNAAFKAWCSWQNRQDFEDDEQGVHHSAVDFEYKPIREDRYSGP